MGNPLPMMLARGMLTMTTPTAVPAAANPNDTPTAAAAAANPVNPVNLGGYPARPSLPSATEVAVAHWVAALRGGAYAQGHFYLMQQSEDLGIAPEFCCLGVACDISDMGYWDCPEDDAKHTYVIDAPPPEFNPAEVDVDVDVDAVAESPSCLPAEVMAQLGIRTNLGEFWVTKEWLDAMYDTAPEVADKIALHLGSPDTGVSASTAELALLAEGMPITLAGLNDTAGLDFADIAAVIDSRPTGLFAAVAEVAEGRGGVIPAAPTEVDGNR